MGAFIAFLIAALTITLLLFGLSYAVGAAQEGVVDWLKTSAPAVKHWGGYILVAVGAWFIALGIFAGFFSDIFPV